MTLEEFIVDYIRQHSGSVTFGELSQAGTKAGYEMHGDMELADGEAFFWTRMSEEFCVAIRDLLDAGRIRIVETTKLDCMVSSPRIMFSNQPWIPSRVETT